MTNCHNCGHTGTFVLLAQFALAVPGPDAAGTPPTDSGLSGDCRSERTDGEVRPDSGGLSLSVQCPVCDSTDVGVAAEDLLARYLSSTTS